MMGVEGLSPPGKAQKKDKSFFYQRMFLLVKEYRDDKNVNCNFLNTFP